MNGFVPVLVAVLLAEIGPRSMLYARAGRRDIVLWVAALIVFGASAAGHVIGPQMTGWADALMISIALVFAALGQMQRVTTAKALVPVLWAFWSGGVGILAFAFAARFGALTTAFGTLGGMLAAALITPHIPANGIPMRPVRGAAVLVLIVTAAIIAVNALRLV